MPETSAAPPRDSGFAAGRFTVDEESEVGLPAVLFQPPGETRLAHLGGSAFSRARPGDSTSGREVVAGTQQPTVEFERTLRVGVIPYLNVALMPTWLGRFNQEHPGIDLSILEISWTDIETGLEEGQMDVGSD